MYLSSTDERTKFTKDAAVQTIILAGSYLGAMLLAGNKISELHASPVNPAIAFLIVFFNSSGKNWASLYIFVIGGFIGSFISLIFFRFVYQKTQEAIEDIEEEEENNEEALMDE
mmetsp:Transcript_2952/g.5001  ORF Transcript_2952/g.5001 Transcript_2952/m.5001 type:complete len:114 (+) Transcript_2952:546-887(+)